MNPIQKEEGYNGIYLERSGKDGRILVENLIAPSECPLDDFQKQEAYKFENSIADYEFETGVTVSEIIKTHKGEAIIAPYFFAEAFLKDKVIIPESIQVPTFSSIEDVYKWLATIAHNSEVNEMTMTKMAKESANYYKQTITESLLSGNIPESSTLDYMPIVLNPAEMIKNSLSIVHARQFIHGLHNQYKEGSDDIDGAKRVLSDIYLAKINSIVVSDIMTLDYLVDQSKMINDYQTEKAASVIIPEAVRQSLETNKLKVIKRFDYLRSGMGNTLDGRSTVVEDDVFYDVDANETESDGLKAPLFSPEQSKKIKEFKLKPSEMVNLYSNILKKANLLSSEDPNTWYPKRTHRAQDGLFQVVINPTANNFSIDGKSGVYKVASEERSLFDVIVIGGFHELEHVNQAQIDVELSKKLKIADLKGKRVSMFRESGANTKQREAEQELFGKSKPIALAYARALQVLESGGDVFSATQAFYNEKRIATPETPVNVIAKEAADRVLRLVHHGGLNSEPMAYAEEKILNKELRDASPEVKVRAFAVTTLDLVDQVRLHKYDLLPMPETQAINWTSIIREETEPYIAKSLK
jgi:hypothetical protein